MATSVANLAAHSRAPLAVSGRGRVCAAKALGAAPPGSLGRIASNHAWGAVAPARGRLARGGGGFAAGALPKGRAIDWMEQGDDAVVLLDTVSEEMLFAKLKEPEFLEQVRGQWCKTAEAKGGTCPAEIENTFLLFVPVPWSKKTRHGMPAEFEKYHMDKDNYCVINIPPQYLIECMIFKPNKLATVMRRAGADEPPEVVVPELN